MIIAGTYSIFNLLYSIGNFVSAIMLQNPVLLHIVILRIFVIFVTAITIVLPQQYRARKKRNLGTYQLLIQPRADFQG